MKISVITILILFLVVPAFAQELGYAVRGTYKRAIAKEKLNAAHTIADINPGYPSSWIASYISMEVVTISNETIRKETSTNDTLTNEQIGMLKMADFGADIAVDVRYIPHNSFLGESDIKVINFVFTVVPEVEAEFSGGFEMMRTYLKKNAVDKIPEAFAKQLSQATVRFVVDEGGQITDAQITVTSEDENVDALLLDAVKGMPKWKPAENGNGVKVRQEFEFSVGNMIGC